MKPTWNSQQLFDKIAIPTPVEKECHICHCIIKKHQPFLPVFDKGKVTVVCSPNCYTHLLVQE